jgi:hypothetical protein
MADFSPEVEVSDIQGQTKILTQTVGTSWVSVPAVAAGAVSSFLIEVPNSNPASSFVEVSLDGGVSSFKVRRGEVLSWQPKGAVTQLSVKGSAAATEYQLILNQELV